MKLVGERRALAAVVFVFWSMIYLVLALAEAAGPQMGRVLYALAGVYGMAFFALVAGYFWARWFAVGLSLYGVLTAVFGIWQRNWMQSSRSIRPSRR